MKIATWNINSVRLRIEQVVRYLREAAPDVLCLQETKCPDGVFPGARLAEAGYPHLVFSGMKGYNGVAFVSRHPLENLGRRIFCGRSDARHAAVAIGEGPSRIVIENVYIPAGGDVPDPEANPKFAHKLAFLAELTAISRELRTNNARHVLVGDLNIAPLPCDVWSHKALLDVVSHTPVETDGLLAMQEAGAWTDAIRLKNPAPELVYSWWSYRSPDWAKADKGRRLDHVWVGRGLADQISAVEIAKITRGWDRPSDHVPVAVTLAS